MRFCVNCGRQLRDGEVCSCQQPAAKHATKTGKGLFAGGDAKKTLSKYWPFLAGGVALIAIVLVLCLALGGGSYKTPVDDIIRTINDRETDLVKIARRVLPDFVEGEAYRLYQDIKDADGFDDIQDEAEDMLQYAYDELEDYFGRNVTITYEIVEKEELSKRELRKAEKAIGGLYADVFEDIVEDWDDMDEDEKEDAADEADMTVKQLDKCVARIESIGKKLEKAKVSKGYELTVDLLIEGKDDEEEYEDVIIRVIKINGSWVLDFTSLSEPSALGLVNDLF